MSKPHTIMGTARDAAIGLNHGAGKGDKPRNISARFAENYDEIDWEHKPGQPRKFFRRYGNLRKNKTLHDYARPD